MHHQQTAHPNDSYPNINFTLNFHRTNITKVLIPPNLFSCISLVVHTTFSAVVIQKLGNMMREIRADPRSLQFT